MELWFHVLLLLPGYWPSTALSSSLPDILHTIVTVLWDTTNLTTTQMDVRRGNSCFSSHKRAESSHAAGSMAFYSSFLWSFLWSVASICQIPPFLQVVLLLPLWCTCCHFHLHQSTWRFLLPNWTDWHPWSLADFECYLHFNSIWLVWFRKTIFVSCYLLKDLKHNPS